MDNKGIVNKQRIRRRFRVRNAVRGTADRPRLCVQRTLKHFGCQVINDEAGRTLVSATTRDKDVQHNIILSILIDHGAIGLVLFLMMVGKWCHTSWQIWTYRLAPREAKYIVLIAAGFGIGYIANGMFQDVLIIPIVGSLLFFQAGLLRGIKANLAGQHKLLIENNAFSNTQVTPPQLVLQP